MIELIIGLVILFILIGIFSDSTSPKKPSTSLEILTKLKEIKEKNWKHQSERILPLLRTKSMRSDHQILEAVTECLHRCKSEVTPYQETVDTLPELLEVKPFLKPEASAVLMVKYQLTEHDSATISSFGMFCKLKKTHGIVVHSGNPLSGKLKNQAGTGVAIIDGQQLIEFLSGRPILLFGGTVLVTPGRHPISIGNPT